MDEATCGGWPVFAAKIILLGPIPENAVVIGFPAKVVGNVKDLKYPDGEQAYPEE